MRHSAIIDKNLDVWVCGNNSFGQLGLGDNINRVIPTKIETLPSIKSVLVGNSFTIFLDYQGYVWYCGKNVQPEMKNVPTKLEGAEKIIKISSGSEHFLLLDEVENVFSFGLNDVGQLGLGHNEDRIIPTLVENIPKIKDICCGSHHSILMDENGICWTFGDNSFGQLGLDQYNTNIPTKIENLPLIKYISAGSCHSILIDIEGNCWAFGNNEIGQLGLDLLVNNIIVRTIPTKLNTSQKFKSAYCGPDHTFLIDIDNKIWGFGDNAFGQLQPDHVDIIETPIKLQFDDTVYSIICNDLTTIIINMNGECFSRGDNRKGQLFLGHTDSVNTLTKIEGLKANILKPRRFERTKSARN